MPYALCPMPYALCPMHVGYLMLLRKAIDNGFDAFVQSILDVIFRENRH